MLEGSLVLLIHEGNTLIMPHYVGEIGLKLMVLAPVWDIEGRNSEIRFEGFIFSIIQSFIRSVIPKSRILVAIMAIVTQVLHCILANCKVHDIARYIEIHALLSALTSSTVLMRGVGQLNPTSLGVETLVQLEADSLLPSVVEMVLGEWPKLDIALIGEIHKLQFEVVPIVEGEDIGVDLFIEG